MRICGYCEHTDGVVYTSFPPMIKCTITNQFHENGHICEVEFVPVVRCKDCKWYEGENHNCLEEMGFARIWEPADYCSFGERKDDDSHPFADDVMMGGGKDDA